MHKFVHMADIHLGAHREPALQKLELQCFGSAMDMTVELGADFILICGDLFHVGIPDLGVVNSAVRKMMEVRDQGVEIYAIYGSHDYTPNGTSVIDILNTVGVLTNVSKWKVQDGRLELSVFQDGKTGAKIAGISARRIGLESKYYEMLDRGALESLEGFKVFAFHSGLTELKPPQLSEMETFSASLFPKGFDYYAGGHIHQRGEHYLEGYANIVYPGPLFTGYGKDLEETAKGEGRGFYLVEFDEKIRSKKFVPVDVFDGAFRAYDLTGMNPSEATALMEDDFLHIDVSGKVVVLRAYGELAAGKPSDVGFALLKLHLSERGALHVYLNRNALSAKGMSQAVFSGEDPATLERRLFATEVSKVRVSESRLKGESGAGLGNELLRLWRQPPKLTEAKKDYAGRMARDGRKVLGADLEGKSR